MALWVTVAEFKSEYKDIAGAADDAFIARALQAAQDAIEGPGEGLDRVVLATANSVQYFDYGGDEMEGRILWVSERGDLCSVNSVTNGDGTTVTTAQYTLYPKTLSDRWPTYDRIVLLPSSNINWTAPTNGNRENAIQVSGKWGMWATAATIPDQIKLAAMQLAAYAMEARKSQVMESVTFQDGGTITVPRGWPANARELLRGWRRL